MTTYTYTTLRTALQSFTEDYGAEFLAALDLIIPLAEDKLLRDLDLEIFDITSSTAFTANSPYLTKPSGDISLRSMYYTDPTLGQVLLEQRSWEYVMDYWPVVSATTSNPKYYSEYSDTQWYIAGTPSTTSTVTMRYVKRPAGLSSTVPSTWLSTNVADLLLHSCLVSCEEYLKADPRVAVWKQEYIERLGAARFELRALRRNDYSLKAQANG
jgi:hypothetical protein